MNSNLALLTVVRECGAGVDVVLAGELHRARLAGFSGDIVFAGVGKTRLDLENALDVGVRCVNVESEAELEVLSEVATARGVVAPVSLRINPGVVNVTAGHAYIATGEEGTKFGIPIVRGIDAAKRAAMLPGIEPSASTCTSAHRSPRWLRSLTRSSACAHCLTRCAAKASRPSA